MSSHSWAAEKGKKIGPRCHYSGDGSIHTSACLRARFWTCLVYGTCLFLKVFRAGVGQCWISPGRRSTSPLGDPVSSGCLCPCLWPCPEQKGKVNSRAGRLSPSSSGASKGLSLLVGCSHPAHAPVPAVNCWLLDLPIVEIHSDPLSLPWAHHSFPPSWGVPACFPLHGETFHGQPQASLRSLARLECHSSQGPTVSLGHTHQERALPGFPGPSEAQLSWIQI